MKKYEIELKALTRCVVGVSIDLDHRRDDIKTACLGHVNDMGRLIELINNPNADLNVLEVIATFSEKLSIVTNRLNGTEETPESIYNSLIEVIYTEMCKTLYEEEK